MKAAVLEKSPGELVIEDVSIAKPGPREVLVRTVNAGLCHSDLHFMEGAWQVRGPTVMGHEAAGVVEAVGDQVDYVAPGDHVITCLSIFCGSCRQCLSGHLSICERRFAMQQRAEPSLHRKDGTPLTAFTGLGAFAEQMLVHEHGLVKIRPEMPLDKASLLGCGVTTGLGAVFRTAKVPAGATVAVIGAGGIGGAAIQGARIAGASKIFAIDLSDEKLETAKKLGATHVVNASETDPVAAVKEQTEGKGVEYAFEAIGLAQTVEQSFGMIGEGGTAVAIGMTKIGEPITVPGHELFLFEKKLIGSMMGSNQFRTDMPRFIDLYLDGRLQLDEMVSRHLKLEQVNEGYDYMRRGEGTRSVIDF